jgi:hypothetical protein
MSSQASAVAIISTSVYLSWQIILQDCCQDVFGNRRGGVVMYDAMHEWMLTVAYTVTVRFGALVSRHSATHHCGGMI